MFNLNQPKKNNDKRSCCVSKCSTTRDGIVFKFPANETVGREWLRRVNSDELKKLPYEVIRKEQRGVCVKHFEKKCYYTNNEGKKLLISSMSPVPTLELDCK